ncbi:hypothetical protein TI04_01950 [Achromatium sp. WMS2]|nr:hypothetical protein TI04_01950 [Achromatium sp. WMS2]
MTTKFQGIMPIMAVNLSLLLFITGCGAIQSPRTNIHGRYDDISVLECRANTLDEVSACELQRKLVQTGQSGVTLSYECKIILNAWDSGYYREKCNLLR